MAPRHFALAAALVVVAAAVGVGAATPGGTAAAETPTPSAANASAAPLGEAISMVMQANAAQAEGAVENGMWAAAYAAAPNASAKQALVEQRVGQLNGTLAELQADRRALQAAFREGTINRSTYRARLSAVVGRLAAIGDGIEETSERGAAVGLNETRLNELRTKARTLGGAEVSRLARNLTGDRGSPGQHSVFEEGAPGASGERGPGSAANGSDGSAGNGPPGEAGEGAPGAVNETGTDASDVANETGAGNGRPTATPTATESSES